MDINDQQQTYAGFMRYTVRSVIAIVGVMVLLAIFVA